MAAKLPASLKSHDLGRFATRAAQLEKFKPAMTYWCNYYIISQILSKGLHTTDEECTTYTTNLMDRLEEMKTQQGEEPAITNDLAAQAYVEQFGLDTFARAEKQMKANKVTNNTADTFYAAATFLELLRLWDKLTPEIHAMVKFAKHHAVRIMKAINAGQDPNATNPVIEDEQEGAELDPNDPEVQAIVGTKADYEPPSVADESIEGTRSVPEDSTPAKANEPQTPAPDPGYFPPVSSSSQSEEPAVPAPVSPLGADPPVSEPSAPSIEQPPPRNLSPPPTIPDTAADFYNTPVQPTVHTPVIPPAPSSATPRASAIIETPRAAAPLAPPFQTPQIGTSAPTPATPKPGVFNTDDMAVAAAQKHAKWAISALNFEDVPTAVKELREALKTLGAS